MKALIVLGNRLNEDGSLSVKGEKRCEITFRAVRLFQPELIILTGGTTNLSAGISEAYAMKRRLTELGLEEDNLVLEEKATDTTENARYSLEIVRKNNIGEVIVISSIEHFGRTEPKNAIAVFRDVIREYPDIHLCMYTEEY